VCYVLLNCYLFIACSGCRLYGEWLGADMYAEGSLLGKGSEGVCDGERWLLEGGDNLSQYCYVGMFLQLHRIYLWRCHLFVACGG
jgi:hypothetical protein